MKLLALLVALSSAMAVHAQGPVVITAGMGCYADKNPELVPIVDVGVTAPFTLEKCAEQCYYKGYDLVADKGQDGCRCGIRDRVTLPGFIDDSNCRNNVGNSVAISAIVPTGLGPSPSPTPPPSPSPSPSPSPAPGPPTVPVKNPGGPSKVFVGKKVFTYMGCFKDRTDKAGRALTGFYSASSARTNSGCVKTCAKKGFLWAATENGNECRCGNELTYVSRRGAKCDKPCSSNNGEKCGGYSYSMSLFKMQ